MNSRPALVLMLLWAVASSAAFAQPPTSAASSAPPTPLPSTAAAPVAATAPAASAPAWQPDNRVILGADDVTLTGTHGGEGGDIAYLQQISPEFMIGAGGDYQTLAGAHWNFGSLNAVFSHPLTATSSWDLHADAHEGSGTSAGHDFTYSIIEGGLGLAIPGGVAADFEESYFNVDHSIGNLPKISLSKAWGLHWMTTLAYAQSYGGNLDTNFGLGRLDFFGRGYSLLGGVSVGRVAPAVINIAGILREESRPLTEAFVGVSKRIARVELSLLGDEAYLTGIKHLTVTLDCTIHFR